VAERVLPHKHCPECGTTMGTKEDYCSKDCKATHDDRIRGKKRQLLWLYFGGVGLFALAMLLLLGGF
jgi:predicted nucleic acid-binding Zn ribbon protein